MPFDTGLREAKGGDLEGTGGAAGLGTTRANKVSQQTSDDVHGLQQCLALCTTLQSITKQLTLLSTFQISCKCLIVSANLEPHEGGSSGGS